MNKAYERINFQNEPSTATPLSATNLNKMDLGLDTIDDRVVTLDSEKSSVVANPQGTATGTLSKVEIDGDIYSISGGGGGGSEVEWTQLVSTGTKIAEIEIDGTTTDVYAPSGGGGGLVDRTFNVASTDWEANTDPTTETDYPYIAEITTSVYSNTSKPIWQMNGVGTIPTLAEQDEIGYIIEAVFSSSGITLYAIDEPTVALVLEVKGE